MHNKNVVYVTDPRLKAENEEMLAMLKQSYQQLKEWRQSSLGEDFWDKEEQKQLDSLYELISKVENKG